MVLESSEDECATAASKINSVPESPGVVHQVTQMRKIYGRPNSVLVLGSLQDQESTEKKFIFGDQSQIRAHYFHGNLPFGRSMGEENNNCSDIPLVFKRSSDDDETSGSKNGELEVFSNTFSNIKINHDLSNTPESRNQLDLISPTDSQFEDLPNAEIISKKDDHRTNSGKYFRSNVNKKDTRLLKRISSASSFSSSDEDEFNDELRDSTHSTQIEQALKLGYSKENVVHILAKIGHQCSLDELLSELIKLETSDSDLLLPQEDLTLRNEVLSFKRLNPDICSGESEDSLSILVSGDSQEGRRNSVTVVGDSGPCNSDDDNLCDIVIDGSNVAMSHGKTVFSCKGIQIAVDWFRARGHQNITVFVPQWRKETSHRDSPIIDQDILYELEKQRVLVFTPSRRVKGRRVVCYDDRYILKLAVETAGIVVSNDVYRDLVNENEEFRKVVDQRLLMYSFVNDRFMPPEDPLGRLGPTLDDFLLKTPTEPIPRPQDCPYGKKCTYGNKCRFYHPKRGYTSQKSFTESAKEQAQSQLQVRTSRMTEIPEGGQRTKQKLTRTKSLIPVESLPAPVSPGETKGVHSRPKFGHSKSMLSPLKSSDYLNEPRRKLEEAEHAAALEKTYTRQGESLPQTPITDVYSIDESRSKFQSLSPNVSAVLLKDVFKDDASMATDIRVRSTSPLKSVSPHSSHMSTPHLTPQVPTTHLTYQVPTPHLTSQVPTPHLTSQVPTPHLTSQVPTPHLTLPKAKSNEGYLSGHLYLAKKLSDESNDGNFFSEHASNSSSAQSPNNLSCNTLEQKQIFRVDTSTYSPNNLSSTQSPNNLFSEHASNSSSAQSPNNLSCNTLEQKQIFRVDTSTYSPNNMSSSQSPNNMSSSQSPNNLSSTQSPNNLSSAQSPNNLLSAHSPSNLSAAQSPNNLLYNTSVQRQVSRVDTKAQNPQDYNSGHSESTSLFHHFLQRQHHPVSAQQTDQYPELTNIPSLGIFEPGTPLGSHTCDSGTVSPIDRFQSSGSPNVSSPMYRNIDLLSPDSGRFSSPYISSPYQSQYENIHQSYPFTKAEEELILHHRQSLHRTYNSTDNITAAQDTFSQNGRRLSSYNSFQFGDDNPMLKSPYNPPTHLTPDSWHHGHPPGLRRQNSNSDPQIHTITSTVSPPNISPSIFPSGYSAKNFKETYNQKSNKPLQHFQLTDHQRSHQHHLFENQNPFNSQHFEQDTALLFPHLLSKPVTGYWAQAVNHLDFNSAASGGTQDLFQPFQSPTPTHSTTNMPHFGTSTVAQNLTATNTHTYHIPHPSQYPSQYPPKSPLMQPSFYNSKFTSAPPQLTSTYLPPTSTHAPHSSTYLPPTSTHPLHTSTHPPHSSTYLPHTSTHPPPTSTYPPHSSAYQPPTSTYLPPTSTYLQPTNTHPPHSSTYPTEHGISSLCTYPQHNPLPSNIAPPVQPPTTPTTFNEDALIRPQDPSYQIYYHLSNVFGESVVRKVLNRNPGVLNPDQICKLIIDYKKGRES